MRAPRIGTQPRAEAPQTPEALVGPYSRVSLATPGDNAELVALADSIKMKAGALSIGYTRQPNYFTASTESGANAFVALLRNKDASLSGTTSLVVRDALLGGAHARYGYFCDLRTLPSMERATWLELVRYYEEAVRYVPAIPASGQPRFFLTTVIDSNERALRLLRGRLPGIEYRTLQPYEMVQSFFRFLPSRSKPPKGLCVRRATPADVPQLREFLAEQNRASSLGEWVIPTGADELDRRCATWADFSFASFWIATTEAQGIVGCVAPRECKHRRAVLTGLNGPQRVAAWGSQAFGARPIRDGEPLDLVYLSHFAVSHTLSTTFGPAVRSALMRTVHHNELRQRGAHALCWLEWPHFRETRLDTFGLACVRTRGTLYQVMLRESVGKTGVDLTLQGVQSPPMLDVSIF